MSLFLAQELKTAAKTYIAKKSKFQQISPISPPTEALTACYEGLFMPQCLFSISTRGTVC